MMLNEIGHQLDENIFPCIKNGGFVTPSKTAVPATIWAEEKNHEKSGQRRPETGAWTRPTRWERPPRRGRPTSETTQIVCPILQAAYVSELTAIQEAYPNTRIWLQADGLWLVSESHLLPGLCQKAFFLTGIPFVRTRIVRAWGFWGGVPLRFPTWIGPRHTNFPDGSVCAFEPSDSTWNLGDSIVELLDLYTLWAFRHLHLQVYGRWPGRQVARHPYERITELRDDEFCGCGNSDNLYGECCREKDFSMDIAFEAASFLFSAGGMRNPPDTVVDFIREQKAAPRILDLVPSWLNFFGIPD